MYADRVALLLRYGVDPDGQGTQHPALQGLRPIERAHVAGAQKIFELLLAAGARLAAADIVDALVGLCMRGERDTIERELDRARACGRGDRTSPTRPDRRGRARQHSWR
jgi:hypothetical protein